MMVDLLPNLMFWTAVSFLILVLLLGKFGFKPLAQILESRERKIRESIEQAENARLEAERLLREYEEKLAEARAEAQKFIAEGKQLGDNLRVEILGKAEEEAKRVVAKAEEQINRDVEQAIKELRAEVADISVSLASKVIEAELDKNAHDQLIEKYLSEVGRLQ
ncbi:MAG TPA: F0F1 ATP synthase subunit B [Anaerolineae bacterium]|jgi:F-type H+-transporting ATPase subunit b|nr:F0F1 ATP synthase subunit B [Anaerolineae bacterium]